VDVDGVGGYCSTVHHELVRVVCVGLVGDWINYFTADLDAEISECCTEPLQRRGLTFTDRLR